MANNWQRITLSDSKHVHVIRTHIPASDVRAALEMMALPRDEQSSMYRHLVEMESAAAVEFSSAAMDT